MLLGLGLVRKAVKLVAILVVLAVVYLGVTAVQVWRTSRRDQSRAAQAIVVMGTAQYNGVPSPDLAARLQHTLALWRAGLAPAIVVTGGGEPGDHYTEAEASAAWLERRGVPDSAIVREVAGTDSYQSLAAAAGYLEPRRMTAVLMVSDPFHEERICSMARRLGLTPYPTPTRTSPIKGEAVLPYYARETLAVAVGRVIGYRRLSYMMHGRPSAPPSTAVEPPAGIG
ncbi:MAG: YdcF family protein [Acidimicrobiales bacterium]